MNLADLAASVRDRLGDSTIPLRTIEIGGDAGLRQIAENFAHGPHATDFQREATLTLDADGAVEVPADFLPGYISSVSHEDLDVEMVMMKTRQEIQYQLCTEFGLYAIEQGKIFTKPPASYQGGDILAGDILATGIAVPTLATLKGKYNPDLVTLVVGLMPGLMKSAKTKGAS